MENVMPTYDFKCLECNETFEKLLPLNRYKEPQTCTKCGGKTKKILTLGHGGIQDDHPKWLDYKIIRQLQDTDDPTIKPIETRMEYKKHLKDNGVVPTN